MPQHPLKNKKIKISISEIFKSVQGEGARAGVSSIFIRTSGCSMRCDYCDTKYAWDREREMDIDEILNEVKNVHTTNPDVTQIVITGGEPLEQKISGIIEVLRAEGYFISIETNGTHRIGFKVDWLTVSPKEFSGYNIDDSLFEQINEIKLVVTDNLTPEIVKKIRYKKEKAPIFLQPQFYDNSKYTKTISLFKKCEDLSLNDIRLGFQLHKLYNIN